MWLSFIVIMSTHRYNNIKYYEILVEIFIVFKCNANYIWQNNLYVYAYIQETMRFGSINVCNLLRILII